MNQNRKVFKVAALLALLLMFAGCAKRVTTGPPVTSFEQVMAYNASLATSNDEIAKAVINAQQTKVITQAEAVAITGYQAKVARIDKELTALLAQGPQALQVNGLAIQNDISAIQTATSNLAASGIFGNKYLAAVQAQAGAVGSLATQMLSALEAAGLVKP